MGKIVTLLVVLIVVAFFAGMTVSELGTLVGNGIQSIFTFLYNIIQSLG